MKDNNYYGGIDTIRKDFYNLMCGKCEGIDINVPGYKLKAVNMKSISNEDIIRTQYKCDDTNRQTFNSYEFKGSGYEMPLEPFDLPFLRKYHISYNDKKVVENILNDIFPDLIRDEKLRLLNI